MEFKLRLKTVTMYAMRLYKPQSQINMNNDSTYVIQEYNGLGKTISFIILDHKDPIGLRTSFSYEFHKSFESIFSELNSYAWDFVLDPSHHTLGFCRIN